MIQRFVGLLLFVCLASAVAAQDAKASTREPARRLTVLSYNIHYGIGMDGKKSLERIARVIVDSKADLVGLQEIGNEAMAKELGRLTKMPFVFGPAKGKTDQYGDAILCRLPFEWVGNHAIPTASSSRYQAMAVDVDVSSVFGKGCKVRFVNTHFDWLQTLGSQEARLAAVEVIERGFFAKSRLPAILAGDLNAVPGSPPLRRLAKKGWHFTDLGKPRFTIGTPKPDRQIDYVLVRPVANWNVVGLEVMDEPVASDHLPVVLQLEWVASKR